MTINLENLIKRNCLGKKRVCAMIEVSQPRLEAIMKGERPTPKEQHMIDVLFRFAHYSNKGFDYSLEIESQKETLENLDKKLFEELARIDAENQERIVNLVEAIKVEGMYLGMFYADDCKEDLITEKVRKVRNGG